MNDVIAPQGSPPPDDRPRLPAVVASPPPREIRVVTDPIPMLDTAKFEHMQRIATVMAETSMIPDSLRFGKGEHGRDALLPMRSIIANCFMVVNQATRWHMDPFAVAQCCSVIYGRLMYEGKLVAAVLDANLGVRLAYEFDNKPGQKLGVTVSGTIPGETKERTIYGCVADWHKGPTSPWATEGAWPRQLRYMGAREWARAHAPAVMLGVIAEDEADEGIALRSARGHAAQSLLPVPDIPDIVSDQNVTAPASPVEDIPDTDRPAPVFDVEGYLDDLRTERGYCEHKKDLKELIASNEAAIGTLPAKDQKRARKILADQE